MDEMKYVVVHCEDTKQNQLFIFPKEIDHDAFAEVLSYIKTGGAQWSRSFRKPISAGFTDLVRCYGESESLKLKSRKDEDAELLASGGIAEI